MNFIRLLPILITCLLLACYAAKGQTAEELLNAKEPECHHGSSVDIQRKARFRGGPNMKITVYDGKHLEFIMQDRRETELMALYVEKASIIPGDFAKRYDVDKWWVLYCDEHKTVHSIVKYIAPDKR